MSDSKKRCPECGRPPGGQHSKPCPSSRESRRLLDQALSGAGRGKVLWAKGQQVSKLTGETLVNPGIPLVNEPKPWFAGGVPAFMRSGK